MTIDQQNLWESFASEWETPHVWEYSPVTPKDREIQNTKDIARAKLDEILRPMCSLKAREIKRLVAILLK